MKRRFDELQHEILRSILRCHEDTPPSRIPNGCIRHSDALRASAAQLFAAANGWQYQPSVFCWKEIEAVAACELWPESVRGLAYDPLLFLDEKGAPVAFASQPKREERRQLDGFLRFAPDMGLYTNIPPAAYASIAAPGQYQFLIFTRQRLPVRWLPEQQEENSPFSVHWSEAPDFHKFLKQVRSPDTKCQEALEHLRSVYQNRGRRAPPELIVSLCHFKTCFYELDSIDDAVAAAIWSMYVAWSKEEVSLILQYNKEIAEITS